MFNGQVIRLIVHFWATFSFYALLDLSGIFFPDTPEIMHKERF